MTLVSVGDISEKMCRIQHNHSPENSAILIAPLTLVAMYWEINMCTILIKKIVILSALTIFTKVSYANENIFLCDYASKWGKIPILAIYTNKDEASSFSFVVTTFGKGIENVKRYLSWHKYPYQRKPDGNIHIEGIKKTCFSSANFTNDKLHSDQFYKQLSPEFLTSNNEQRVGILERLARRQH